MGLGNHVFEAYLDLGFRFRFGFGFRLGLSFRCLQVSGAYLAVTEAQAEFEESAAERLEVSSHLRQPIVTGLLAVFGQLAIDHRRLVFEPGVPEHRREELQKLLEQQQRFEAETQPWRKIQTLTTTPGTQCTCGGTVIRFKVYRVHPTPKP